MKKVIFGNELIEKTNNAVNMLCDTVKTTLGPIGNNIIINNSTLSPYITNDGVTIAENIESDDEVINTILEIAKEASIKTNEVVGDGTTTTLVLLQSFYNNGLKLIEQGINPIILKNNMLNILNDINKMIAKKSKKPTNKNLLQIATISAKNTEIGKNVYEVFKKVKNKTSIELINNNKIETEIKYINGYILDTMPASPYIFSLNNEINLKDAYILLIDGILNNIEKIANIINYLIDKKQNLLIIADDYDNDLINELINIYTNNILNIIPLKNPEYGKNQKTLLKDISVIASSKILLDSDEVNISDLGCVNNININSTITTINFNKTEITENYINEIKYMKTDFDIDFYNKRIASFNNGIAKIYIGGITETEKKEKRMKYMDAIEAISVAKNGILPGAGITYLEISDSLKKEDIFMNLYKEALTTPFKQILINSGLDYEKIFTEIKKNNFNKLFNVKTNSYENINNTTVIDPKDVLISSLSNAVSISSMLLTSSHLIINEYKNNINKNNEYSQDF